MAELFFADLVRESSLGTGTGALALAGAVPGHRRFADAVPPGATFHYAIAGITHAEQWETGEGALDAAGALLRTPLASSAGGAAVDLLPGLKAVTLTVAADWFAAQQAREIGLSDVDGLEAALGGKAALTGAAFSGALSAPSLALGTDLAVADGGTGASTAAGARANLGLAIGSDVAAHAPVLAGLATLDGATGLVEQIGPASFAKRATGTAAAGSVLTRADGDGRYVLAGAYTAADVLAKLLGVDGAGSGLDADLLDGLGSTAFAAAAHGHSAADISGTLAVAQGGTGAATAAAARASLGLGTIATQAASSVSIAGGTASLSSVTVTSPTAVLTVKDSDTSGNGAIAFVEFRDSAGSRYGYVGKGNGANPDLYVANENGAILFTAGGNAVFRLENTLGNFASDAAAAAGGVAVGSLYRNGSALMIRVA